MEGPKGGQHRPEDDEPRLPASEGDSPVSPARGETSDETDSATTPRIEGEDPDIVISAQQLSLGRFAVGPDEARTTEEDETADQDDGTEDPPADPVNRAALQDLAGLIRAEQDSGVAPDDPLQALHDELHRRIADRERRRGEQRALPEPREPDPSEQAANEGGSPVSAMEELDDVQGVVRYAQYDAEDDISSTEAVEDSTDTPDADARGRLPSPRPPSDPKKPDNPNARDPEDNL